MAAAKGASAKPGKAHNTRSRASSPTPPKPKKPASKATQKARKKEKGNDKSEDESGDEDPEADDDTRGIKIHWNVDGLLELLISTIVSNPDIKQGLFPGPGGHVSTTKGGGKKKADFQRRLAALIFEDHPKYSSAYAELQASKIKKDHRVFGNRVKNRLQAMGKITRDYNLELGSTGEGILADEDVDESLDNKFVNKWKAIKAECPWFLEMQALIGERPNLTPVGLGNSGTTVDFSVLAVGDVDATASSDAENLGLATEPSSESEAFPPGDNTSDLDKDRETSPAPMPAPPPPKKDVKRKADVTSTSSSAPVAARSTRPAKKSKLEEFASAAIAEEQTRQKELEFARAKVESNAKVAVAREQAKAKATELKLQLKLEKARLKHELELAKLTHSQAPVPAPQPHASHSQATYNFDNFDDSYNPPHNTYLPMP